MEYELDPELRVPACQRCPNLVSCRTQIVNGVGPVNADIVFVGEAPGATEDETGQPFVGRSGHILDSALEDIGLARDDVRITNCVRCRPPENRDPYVTERDNCNDYLSEELLRINPSVVVPLGRIPMNQLLPDIGPITDVTGTIHHITISDTELTVIPCLHPAATIYNRSLSPKFEATFETISKSI